MNEKHAAVRAESATLEEAVQRLVAILAILRKECPWDRAQTHESLRICMLEEAYEVCEAIDTGNFDNLEEELGDVLLQVLFHSALAAEASRFGLVSVINRECEKLIRRHPHVFSKENVKSIDKSIEKWENVKWKEKEGTSHSDRLATVPRAFPALVRSYKIQAKAAKAGFDWDDVSGAFQKVKEETEELAAACGVRDDERVAEELGDLLFSVVNVARFLDVNPELALNATSDKFIKRFAYIEGEATARGNKLEDMTLQEMDCLWEKAKLNEGCRHTCKG
ncbi:MAG: nucleoside triphosphate pyrophosphohydrolase [Clostridiales bacterium]|nr:nucleoside triphosphate pyrophosphohydrolase [Clostridiales bacterium]